MSFSGRRYAVATQRASKRRAYVTRRRRRAVVGYNAARSTRHGLAIVTRQREARLLATCCHKIYARHVMPS